MRSGTFLNLFLPFLVAIIFLIFGVWRLSTAAHLGAAGFNFEVTVDVAFSFLCAIAGLAFAGYNFALRSQINLKKAQAEFWRELGQEKKGFVGSFFVDQRFEGGSQRGWFYETKEIRPKGLKRHLWLKHSEPVNDILIAEQDWSDLGSDLLPQNDHDLIFKWLDIAQQHDIPAYYVANGEIQKLSERQFHFAIFDPGTFQYYFYQHLMRGAPLPEDLISTSLNRFARSLDAYEDLQ